MATKFFVANEMESECNFAPPNSLLFYSILIMQNELVLKSVWFLKYCCDIMQKYKIISQIILVPLIHCN